MNTPPYAPEKKRFMPQRSWESAVVGWVLRYRVVIVVLAVAVTVGALLTVVKLRLSSNMIALLPEKRQSIQALHRIVDKIGGSGDLMVMIESSHPEESKRFARQLLPTLRKLPWVKDAEIGRDTSFFEKNRLLYIALEDLKTIAKRIDERLKYEKLIRQPLYIDLGDQPPTLDFSDIEKKYEGKGNRQRYFETPDGKILLIVIHPRGITSNLGFVRKIYQELSDVVAAQDRSGFPNDMKLSLGGTFRNRLVEYDTIVQDVQSSAVIVAIGLILLLTWFFRHPLAIAAVCIPLLMGISWSFAITYYVIGQLNLITVFLIVVLMGLGIDFGIHMFARFQRERDLDQPVNAVLTATLRKAGRPALLAAMTTAASFFVLMVTDFRGFYDFGFIAGTGLVMSTIAYLVVFPALLSYVHQWKLISVKQPTGYGTTGQTLRSETLAPTRNRHLPALIVGLCAAATVAALYTGRNAEFEYDLHKIRSGHREVGAFKQKRKLVFPKARDPAAILVDGPFEAARVGQLLEDKKRRLGDASTIAEVWTIHNLIPEHAEEKLTILRRLNDQLKEISNLVDDKQQKEIASFRKQLTVDEIRSSKDLPDRFVRPFLGLEGTAGQLVFLYQQKSLLDLRNAVAFSQEVSGLTIDDKTYHAASEPLVYADMFFMMRDDIPIVLMLSALCVLVLLAAELRSIKSMAIVLLPLVVGIVWMVGIMAIVPIKLNLLNATVLPVIFGLGIDSGVHIFHHAREVGWQNMSTVVRETGTAVAACTGTSMIGFGAMLIAAHPGLRSIGLLAFVGLGACLIAALVFLPSVLTLIRIQPKGKQAGS